MRLTTAAALVACLGLGTAAQAGEPRRHDGGFFLRLAFGGGYARSSITEGGNELELRGATGNADVAIGAVVARNFAIHANLGGWSVPDPTVRFNRVVEEVQDTALTLNTFGAGVTWYFEQSNVYLTANAGAANLEFDSGRGTESSDMGFALEVGLGKEWWVSDRWGLGLSGSAGYHSVPGESGSDVTGPSFAIRFSATFN